jgi:two-component system OmpR family response regulator
LRPGRPASKWGRASEWSAHVVQAAYAPDETWIVVVGRTDGINTGFASAVEVEGWSWREAPDVGALLAEPMHPRTVIALRVLAFTVAAYTTVRHLACTLGLPVVVFSHERHSSVIRATLQAGADDFIPIPITVEEMIARLGAVIRVRCGAHGALLLSDYRLNESLQTVSIADGPTVRLTLSEYRLFRTLFAARNRPVSRERLLALPLSHVESDGQNALDATVSRLRRKLGAERVITIRGTGYQLMDTRHPVLDVVPEKTHAAR